MATRKHGWDNKASSRLLCTTSGYTTRGHERQAHGNATERHGYENKRFVSSAIVYTTSGYTSTSRAAWRRAREHTVMSSGSWCTVVEAAYRLPRQYIINTGDVKIERRGERWG